MKPSDYIGKKAQYDEHGQLIWAVQKNGELERLVDLRGWGSIQHKFKDDKGNLDHDKAAAFQDELGQWIVDAINEKLERDGK